MSTKTKLAQLRKKLKKITDESSAKESKLEAEITRLEEELEREETFQYQVGIRFKHFYQSTENPDFYFYPIKAAVMEDQSPAIQGVWLQFGPGNAIDLCCRTLLTESWKHMRQCKWSPVPVLRSMFENILKEMA